MGSRETKVVSIDKNCLSCSEKPTTVLSLFKIACLAYRPSEVEYDGSKIAREKLIELRKDKLSEKLDAYSKLSPNSHTFTNSMEESSVPQSLTKNSLNKIRDSLKVDMHIRKSFPVRVRNAALGNERYTEYNDMTKYRRKYRDKTLASSFMNN